MPSQKNRGCEGKFPGEELRQAEKYAVKLLAMRLQTRNELRDRVIRRGFSPETAQRVMEQLTKTGYLDDCRFCQEWLEERLRRHPVGPLKARQNLINRGISEEEAGSAVTGFFGKHEETVIARNVARSKLKVKQTMKPVSLARFLAGRGFTQDVVVEIVAELTEQEVEW